MKTMILALTLALTTSAFTVDAANLKDNVKEAPKTKLEQFSAQTGVVIVRGFHKIGSVAGLYRTQLNVEAKEFTSISDGRVEYGITIEAFQENGKYDKTHKSFIDYDEIDSLIAGIDYVSKITADATKLEDFQADYSTIGDLKVSVFSTNGKVMSAVSSGKYGTVTAYYKLEKLAEVKAMIIAAKAKIDEVK